MIRPHCPILDHLRRRRSISRHHRRHRRGITHPSRSQNRFRSLVEFGRLYHRRSVRPPLRSRSRRQLRRDQNSNNRSRVSNNVSVDVANSRDRINGTREMEVDYNLMEFMSNLAEEMQLTEDRNDPYPAAEGPVDEIVEPVSQEVNNNERNSVSMEVPEQESRNGNNDSA